MTGHAGVLADHMVSTELGLRGAGQVAETGSVTSVRTARTSTPAARNKVEAAWSAASSTSANTTAIPSAPNRSASREANAAGTPRNDRNLA